MTRHLSEADWQRSVIDTARCHAWRVCHFRPARRPSGAYSMPMTGDRGFPDLVLARGGVVLAAELKTAAGRLGPGQAGVAGGVGAVRTALAA